MPVAAYAAISAANQMLWLTFTPITDGSAHHYGVSAGAVGWLAEIFPLVYVVLALPAGRCIDVAMPRWLAVGAALTALGAVLRLGADTYGAALAGQVLVAIAQPLVLNAVTAMSDRYLVERDRAAGIAVSSAGIFGGMVLALLSGAVLGAGHLRVLLIGQAGFAVAAAVVLCACLRSPAGGGRRAGVPVAGEPSAPSPTALRQVWADARIRALVGLVCVGFGVFIALTTWLQVLLDPAGVSDAASGYLLLVLVVAGVAGSALLPPLIADRGAEIRFVAVSVLGSAACLVLLAAAPGLGTAIVASTVIGALLLTDLPVILELVQQVASDAAGTASALVWLAGNAAGLVAALLVQRVRHQPALAFALLAAILAAGLPLLVLLSRRRACAVPGSSSSTTGP